MLHLSQRHHHQFTSHLQFLSHHRLSCLAMPTDGPHRMAHLDDSLLPTTAITGYTTGDGSHRMAHLDDSLLPTTAITGYTTADGSHRMAHLDDSLLPTTAITGYTTADGSHRMAHLDDSLLPTTAITGYTTADGSHRMAHLDDSLLPTTAITGYTTADGSHRMAHLDDSLLPTTAITGYTTGLQKLSANPSFDHCHNSRNCWLFFAGARAAASLQKTKQTHIIRHFFENCSQYLQQKKTVKSQKNNLTDLLIYF